MRIGSRRVLVALTASLSALTLLPACGADAGHSATTSTRTTSATTAVSAVTTTTAIAAPLTTQGPRTEKWIDLSVGECLADPPPSDPSVVTVTIVDCATAHQAEVYSRAAVGVNSAVADVANRECDAGLARYTGRPVDGSQYAITYLIDSNQDRTSANPAASTVICLLQAADGQPLTASARR
jgi:hypothetical protein